MLTTIWKRANVRVRNFIPKSLTKNLLSIDSNKKQLSAILPSYKLLPLLESPVIPNFPVIVQLTQDQYHDLINFTTSQKTTCLAASLIKNPDIISSYPKEKSIVCPKISQLSDVHEIGTLCYFKLDNTQANESASEYNIGLFPKSKIKIKSAEGNNSQLLTVKVEEIPNRVVKLEDLYMEQKALYSHMMDTFMKLLHYRNTPINIESLVSNFSGNIMGSIHVAISSLAMLPSTFLFKMENKNIPQIMQEVYQEADLTKQLSQLDSELTNMLTYAELWNKLENKHQAGKNNKEEMDKLKSIFNSLRDQFEPQKDERIEQVKRFNANLVGKKVPKHIQAIIDEEITKYMSLEKYHSESSLTRTYLDYLTSLPWGITSSDSVDIEKARAILDADHYGMDEVKDRIMEFLSVSKLQNSVHGKILLFVGPPGVGKTSIGESIARAVGRKFKRISVGGDKDTSTLKGFRRTYIGAIPGKIVQAFKSVKVENPIILIDEVDKIGMRSMHGDPTGVLLEILDPEQNNAFTDDFLDIPLDLSKTLFLCTANSIENMHPALLDRMEVITISGYTAEEKLHILNKYLLPKAIQQSGLTKYLTSLNISERAKIMLIQSYCREPGVRSLFKYIKRIAEKTAFQIAKSNTAQITVTPANLHEMIGKHRFSSSLIYPITPIGVVCGLAYSEYGGSVLFIEASEANFNQPKIGLIKMTGHLGDVMKESSAIAHTFAKNFLNIHFPSNKQLCAYFDSMEIHLHFPEGAISKDGPSAGIAITTTLLSLALKKPILQGIAMTGEISLLGKVLPIGGVKEKVMAAQREGVKTVILPKQNEEDYQVLAEGIKKDVKAVYVNDYMDVFKIVFSDVKIEK